MISKKKLGWKILFLASIVVWVFSLGWVEAIGPIGLLQYLAFMVSGGYVVLFVYANWDVFATKK